MVRTHPHAVVVVAATFLAACSGGGGGSSCTISSVLPVDDGAAPASRLDLSHWTLTLPVDAAGATTGPADTIEADELLAGYTSQWFHATDDGGVAFWAPVNGAKTPNSQYARSELREVIDPADHTVNWHIADHAALSATAAVAQTAAATRKVIIGKIVGYSSAEADLTALLHVIYFIHNDTCQASLYGLLSDAPTKGAATRQLMLIDHGLDLNEAFSYSIEVDNGTLTLRSGARELSAVIDPSWASVPVYFRAGAGLNAAGASGADGGSVTYYDLQVTH
jgi:Alginate lyase